VPASTLLLTFIGLLNNNFSEKFPGAVY